MGKAAEHDDVDLTDTGGDWSEEAEGAKGRPLVNALSRGLAVLQVFENAERPLGNQDIAAGTGLPKSTVSRITNTLTELGYLVFREDLEKYQIGPRVLSLANAFQRTNSVATILLPPMQELATKSRGTVGLAIRDKLEMVYLQICRGVSHIFLHQEVGMRMPLTGSALGLAAICATPAGERNALLARLKRAETGDWTKVLERIETACREIAEEGFCTAIGTWHEEINGVSAAFRLPGQITTYAINIGGPSFWLTPESLRREHGPRLRDMLASLEARRLIETARRG